MNNSPINSTINSTTVVELADASSLRQFDSSIQHFTMVVISVVICSTKNGILLPNWRSYPFV